MNTMYNRIMIFLFIDKYLMNIKKIKTIYKFIKQQNKNREFRDLNML